MDLENDERIQALTQAAAETQKANPDRSLPLTPRLRHRFERWGMNTSFIFLEQLEKLGWTVTKKEDDG